MVSHKVNRIQQEKIACLFWILSHLRIKCSQQIVKECHLSRIIDHD